MTIVDQLLQKPCKWDIHSQRWYLTDAEITCTQSSQCNEHSASLVYGQRDQDKPVGAGLQQVLDWADEISKNGYQWILYDYMLTGDGLVVTMRTV